MRNVVHHDHLKLTNDPRNDEDLHPCEGCRGHAVEQQWVRVELGSSWVLKVGHVWQQGGACETVSSIQDEKTQENCEGRGMGHKLHEGATHHFPHLSERSEKIGEREKTWCRDLRSNLCIWKI